MPSRWIGWAAMAVEGNSSRSSNNDKPDGVHGSKPQPMSMMMTTTRRT